MSSQNRPRKKRKAGSQFQIAEDHFAPEESSTLHARTQRSRVFELSARGASTTKYIDIPAEVQSVPPSSERQDTLSVTTDARSDVDDVEGEPFRHWL